MSWHSLPVCDHKTLSPPDPSGGRLCVDCGIYTPGIRNDMLRAFEIACEPHTRRCVQTPLGWCCSPDCGVRRSAPS